MPHHTALPGLGTTMVPVGQLASDVALESSVLVEHSRHEVAFRAGGIVMVTAALHARCALAGTTAQVEMHCLSHALQGLGTLLFKGRALLSRMTHPRKTPRLFRLKMTPCSQRQRHVGVQTFQASVTVTVRIVVPRWLVWR